MVATRAQGQRRFYRLTAEPFTQVLDWVGELVAAAAAGDSRNVEAPETAAVDLQVPESENDAPTPTRVPERSLPWFAAETTDVTPEAAEAGDTPEATSATAPAGTFAPPVTNLRQEENPDEAQTPDNSEFSLRSGRIFEDIDQTVSAPTEKTDISAHSEAPAGGREVHSTGDILNDGAHAEPAAQPRAVHDAEPHDEEPRAVFPETTSPEIAELTRPRGAAHRRQSGLLFTLTGFRRRNRGSRRG